MVLYQVIEIVERVWVEGNSSFTARTRHLTLRDNEKCVSVLPLVVTTFETNRKGFSCTGNLIVIKVNEKKTKKRIKTKRKGKGG